MMESINIYPSSDEAKFLDLPWKARWEALKPLIVELYTGNHGPHGKTMTMRQVSMFMKSHYSFYASKSLIFTSHISQQHSSSNLFQSQPVYNQAPGLGHSKANSHHRKERHCKRSWEKATSRGKHIHGYHQPRWPDQTSQQKENDEISEKRDSSLLRRNNGSWDVSLLFTREANKRLANLSDSHRGTFPMQPMFHPSSHGQMRHLPSEPWPKHRNI